MSEEKEIPLAGKVKVKQTKIKKMMEWDTKTLGEQWVEVIDGEKHMYKAIKGDNCKGCAFGCCNDEEFECCVFGCRVLGNHDLVVKDLGILRDGLLPCPFCGEYPDIIEDENEYHISCNECAIPATWWPKTKQQAINVWNRRN